MAMSAGNAACSTGLSKRIYDYWTGDATNGFSVSLSPGQTAQIKSLCYAIARGIIDEVNNHGVCEITVSAGGLQESTTAGNPTNAPASPQVLTGIIG